MHSPTAKPGGGGEGEIRKTHRMKKKKLPITGNYFYLITHCALCPRLKSLLAGWHSLYLRTQCTGEHRGCLVKVFQPIWAPIWAQLAPAFLRVAHTPVKSEVMLSSAPTSHNSWSRGKTLGAEACRESLPKGCPSSFPDCPGSLAVFPSQEARQAQRAAAGSTALPETPSPPREDTLCSQPEGRRRHPARCHSGGGTQPATNAPHCLGAKGWISFY